MESNPLLKTQEEIDNIIRYLKKCPEEYLKMVQKCLKTNVNVYKYIDQDVRDSEEIKNMMFENAKAIERIKEKAKFKSKF